MDPDLFCRPLSAASRQNDRSGMAARNAIFVNIGYFLCFCFLFHPRHKSLKFTLNLKLMKFSYKTLHIFRSGESFTKMQQSETVMNTLLQNTTKPLFPLDQKYFSAFFMGRVSSDYLAWAALLMSDGLLMQKMLGNTQLSTDAFIRQTEEYLKQLL